MGVIELEGMEFYAFHGCFKEEQIAGNKFIVNLRIETDCSKASETDDINDALNYQTVYYLLKQEMEKKSHLLEHICKRILDVLYNNYPEIAKAWVKVSKMNPPMGGRIEKVSLVLTR